MTITELISKLEKVKEKYGDINYLYEHNDVGVIYQDKSPVSFFLCSTEGDIKHDFMELKLGSFKEIIKKDDNN
jgi:hypothetical protein